MIIFPAIDIISGQPVRLYQGDYAKKEIVAESVLDTALKFQSEGAEWIHLVDLDGAKAGVRKNADLIIETARKLKIPVEVGGGIRTMEDVEYYLNHGVKRVILGTAAISDQFFLKQALKQYHDAIAVGMDCHNGMVSGSGWLEDSSIYYLDFAKQMQQLGVSTLIFTDISKDGTLAGPNLEMLEQLKQAVTCNITASGGIHNLSDIKALVKLGVYGAITGKAMYAGTLNLKQAIREGKKKC
ncbi:MAG: 1-(5-phosphoribosyl)-5-[(5-phosphoribosylamino)methylideneamino]imidazole-4-carboxamide isomerase [Solobacterium sp.]|jgi:phosphoribosylformimino-5-aminoimidazole carboxamide ribotide isomerase|nr:1-(5-phosphoribosyl)-5-[(5-phosphoribosylamino)methylideneamino]imidazole-4-carboxamide isomerase [Solobacterium sp.]MCH4265504.1 1-(5-phosphoribosyl)-5-[(5-phosphoribosylamino)methylideneamino]imidazole-4-carboxamide isomerase [Solobacterium sp.]